MDAANPPTTAPEAYRNLICARFVLALLYRKIIIKDVLFPLVGSFGVSPLFPSEGQQEQTGHQDWMSLIEMSLIEFRLSFRTALSGSDTQWFETDMTSTAPRASSTPEAR